MNDVSTFARIVSGDLETLHQRLPQGEVVARSVRGPDKSTGNEDVAAVVAPSPKALVLGLADGVGGSPGGRAAAKTVMKSIMKSAVKRGTEPVPLRAMILDAIERANGKILEQGRGAATTVAVAEIANGMVRSYHVGDSEVLVVGQRGKVKLRVVAHSPTGFAVQAGLIDEDEAVDHEARHLLLNVVGSSDMTIEVGAPIRLAPHDTVLLASDGLLDNLYSDEIIDIVRCGPLEKAADKLSERAIARMADPSDKWPSKPDDMTFILFRPARQLSGNKK
jgi:serine/threonine protein phosphatase PrpC